MAASTTPLIYSIMLKSLGAADYKPAGQSQLGTEPVRGAIIEFRREGRAVGGIVDAVFIPPGCEENCIGTVFVSER
jgi:hypothetical protein